LPDIYFFFAIEFFIGVEGLMLMRDWHSCLLQIAKVTIRDVLTKGIFQYKAQMPCQ
jgi:hypothetical protein